MSAYRALDAARAAGINVRLDGQDLILSGAAEPSTGMLGLLRQHKRTIVALLQRRPEGPMQGRQSCDELDWLELYDEQLAIYERDHGLQHAEAERRAFDSCTAEWLWRTAVVSAPGPCPICGDADRANDPLLAIGIIGGRAWLHIGCVKVWCSARKAEAVSALAAMGIANPQGSST
jgi:hypothetical protein